MLRGVHEIGICVSAAVTKSSRKRPSSTSHSSSCPTRATKLLSARAGPPTFSKECVDTSYTTRVVSPRSEAMTTSLPSLVT